MCVYVHFERIWEPAGGRGDTTSGLVSGKAFKNSLFFIFWNMTSQFQFINNQFLTLIFSTVGSYKSLYL